MALDLEEGLNLGVTSDGADIADGEDELLDLRQCARGRGVGGAWQVVEAQAEAAALEPFVAGLARNTERMAGLRKGAGVLKSG